MTEVVPGLRQTGIAPVRRRIAAGIGQLSPTDTGGGIGRGGGGGSALVQAGVIAFPIDAEVSPFTMPVLEQTAVGTYLSLYFCDQWGWGMQVTAITDTKGNSYELDAASWWYGTQVWRALMTSPVGPGDQLQVTYESQFGEPNWGTGYVAGTTFKRLVNLSDFNYGDAFQHINVSLATLPGAVVIGYGGFFRASEIVDPTGPWGPHFLKDLSVFDSEVIGNSFIAVETGEVSFDPSAPDGSWDEGIVLLYTH